MTKIAILNDIHKGARNDLGALQRQQAKFDRLLIKEIDKRKIETVLIPGDVFDRRKYINFVTLGEAGKSLFEPLAERVQSGQLQVHITPGNHDIPYRNSLRYSSLPLLLNGYPFDIHMDPVEINFGQQNVLMLPWICAENYEETLQKINDSNARYCLGHLELVGFEMHRGDFSKVGMNPEIFSKFHWVGSGHYHHRSIKDNIHYLGATYQFTWADYKDPRGITFLDIDTGHYEFFDNPFESFHIYHYNDVKNELYVHQDTSKHFHHYTDSFVKIKIEKKTNSYMFDLLLEQIGKYNPAKISVIEESLEIFNDMNMEDENLNVEDTPTLIGKYIDNLQLEEKSDKLKSFMTGIYQEAISLENID